MRGSEARIRPLAHMCTRALGVSADTYAQAMHTWRMFATSNSLVRARLLSQSIASPTPILPGHHHDKPPLFDAPLNTEIAAGNFRRSTASTAVSASPPGSQNANRSAPPLQANPASPFQKSSIERPHIVIYYGTEFFANFLHYLEHSGSLRSALGSGSELGHTHT